MYDRVFKRLIDFLLSAFALLVLSPLLLVLTLLGAFAMRGNPFFMQIRPGRQDKYGVERKVHLIKFRTMNNKTDPDGRLLPDEQRLNGYGRALRATSLDELPELLNILAGELAVCGPRPQLLRDLVFMTPEQRRRHSVRPGLTGLAQVNGRNNISWEQKFALDLQYIDRGIRLGADVKIIFQTVGKVLLRRDVVREGTDSDLDYGDWLLQNGKITREEYTKKQRQADALTGVSR